MRLPAVFNLARLQEAAGTFLCCRPTSRDQMCGFPKELGLVWGARRREPPVSWRDRGGGGNTPAAIDEILRKTVESWWRRRELNLSFGIPGTYWWRTTSGPNSRRCNWFRLFAAFTNVV